MLGYGILTLLLLRGLRATFNQAHAWAWRLGWFALMGTAIVASMDELHQYFIPSRTGKASDVLLDSTAGLIFLLIAYARLRRSSPAEQIA